jgi:hypothetical protein
MPYTQGLDYKRRQDQITSVNLSSVNFGRNSFIKSTPGLAAGSGARPGAGGSTQDLEVSEEATQELHPPPAATGARGLCFQSLLKMQCGFKIV